MKLHAILCETVEIARVDQEEDWETAEEVEHIFRMSGIRPDRWKQVGYAARVDGAVAGGVYTSWHHDPDDDSEVFGFDVAVDPDFRGFAKVGIRLIDAAIDEYESEKGMYDRTKMLLWVVNPALADFLQRHYDFEVGVEHSDGSAHLVRY